MKNTVVLMTTWNRPHLLRCSLPIVIRESQHIDAQVIVSDDCSTCPATLSLLSDAQNQGVTLWRRDYKRPTMHSGHILTQYNNLYAFHRIIEEHQAVSRIIKVDDDTLLSSGALETMLAAWDKAEARYGSRLLAMSGIRTIWEHNAGVLEDHSEDGYTIMNGCCNAAVAYSSEGWRKAFLELDMQEIERNGFDGFMWKRPNSVCCTTVPSVAYHMPSFGGVHTPGELDVNVDFIGDHTLLV